MVARPQMALAAGLLFQVAMSSANSCPPNSSEDDALSTLQVGKANAPCTSTTSTSPGSSQRSNCSGESVSSFERAQECIGRVGDLYIRASPTRGSVDLSGITSVARDLVIEFNVNVMSVNLDRVQSVGGEMFIQLNDQLQTFTMRALEEVAGRILILGNRKLCVGQRASLVLGRQIGICESPGEAPCLNFRSTGNSPVTIQGRGNSC